MNDGDIQFLKTLEDIVVARRDNPEEGSYTSSLFAAGTQRIAQKVGEEAVEVALAACTDNKQATAEEAADLLYHLVVLLAERRISLSDVVATLESRHSS